MKRVTLAVSLFIVTLMVYGCSDDPLTTENGQLLLAPGTSTKVPIDESVYIPCADEDVLLSGTLHFVFSVTIDAIGSAHLVIHTQPMGVKGVGKTTGDIYKMTGVNRSTMNILGLSPYIHTVVDNYRIIGPGKENNSLLHAIYHITVNANGEATAVVSTVSVECK